jgi:hypothetical protein
MCRKHGNFLKKIKGILLIFLKNKIKQNKKNGGGGGIFNRILFSFEKKVSPNGKKSPKKTLPGTESR